MVNITVIFFQIWTSVSGDDVVSKSLQPTRRRPITIKGYFGKHMKPQMKCSKIRHFIRASTFSNDEYNLQGLDSIIIWKFLSDM